MKAIQDSLTQIQVRVLLFSVLRERLGTADLSVSMEAGQDTSDLVEQLSQAHPILRSYTPVLRIAVNEEYVDGSVPLADGDEVALITPVSGG